MRSKLLIVTVLTMLVIVVVSAALASGMRRAQMDLSEFWLRTDELTNEMRLAAICLGRMEAALPSAAAPAFNAELSAAASELSDCVDRLATLVRDDELEGRLTRIRLIMAELSVRAAGNASAEIEHTVVQLRQEFGGVWIRSSELSSRAINEIAFRQQRQTDRLLIVLVVAAIAGGTFVASYVIRVSRPLEDFVEATKRISEGDWSHRVASPRARELHELAAAFNRMAEKLATAEARRNEAAQEMLVTVSHEVRNALASISGIVQLLRRHRDELSPAVVSALSKIDDTVERVAQTVIRLRDFESLHVADYPGGLKMFDLGRDLAIGSGRPSTPCG